MSERTITATGWQLAGNAADAYEQFLVPTIFEAISTGLVARAGVGAGDRVLDVACGTGCAARAAARAVGAGGAVTGLDVNPDMLATARRAAEGMTPPIEYHQGEATDLPFDDHHFDVVLCQEAVQFLDDRVAAFREMQRVARPGGRVACSVLRPLEHNRAYEVFAHVLGRHAGEEAATMMRSPFNLADDEQLRSDAVAAGLQDVTIHYLVGQERFPSVAEFVHWEAASSPLAGPLSALLDDQLGRMVDDLAGAFASYIDDGGVTFPNETRLLVGTVGS